MEFKLIVQPEIGLEFVTHNSHLLLMITVVLVNEAYFCTPLVMVTVCALAACVRPIKATSSDRMYVFSFIALKSRKTSLCSMEIAIFRHNLRQFFTTATTAAGGG